MMRSIAFLLTAVFVASGATISGQVEFDRNELLLAEQDGMTTVSLSRCVGAWEIGAPSVPVAVVQLVVPQGLRVTGVRVDALETDEVGQFELYPVQPPRPVSDPGPFDLGDVGRSVPPDPRYYGSTYPVEVATLGHQGSMFGYNIASVFVAPVQYDGTSGRLSFHSRVSFTLDLEPADLGYLPVRNRSDASRQRIEAQVASIVLNPEDVAAYAP